MNALLTLRHLLLHCGHLFACCDIFIVVFIVYLIFYTKQINKEAIRDAEAKRAIDARIRSTFDEIALLLLLLRLSFVILNWCSHNCTLAEILLMFHRVFSVVFCSVFFSSLWTLLHLRSTDLFPSCLFSSTVSQIKHLYNEISVYVVVLLGDLLFYFHRFVVFFTIFSVLWFFSIIFYFACSFIQFFLLYIFAAFTFYNFNTVLIIYVL